MNSDIISSLLCLKDWISFVHPEFGWCHTFDPVHVNQSMVALRDETKEKDELIFLVIKFNFNMLTELIEQSTEKEHYYSIFLHEDFHTRWDMNEFQEIKLKFDTSINVKFKKTVLKKLTSQKSKCNNDPKYNGINHCKIQTVKFSPQYLAN